MQNKYWCKHRSNTIVENGSFGILYANQHLYTEPYTPHYRQDFTTEDLNKNECIMTNIWISLESTNAIVKAMDK